MRRAAMVAIAVGLAAGAALAGPLQPERVASSAKWVAHLDVEAAMKAELVQFVLQQPDVMAKVEAAVKKGMEKLGIDPTKDIKSITLYGMGYEKTQAVAIGQGKVDKDKLLALIPKDGHEQLEYNGVTIHSWPDPKGGTTNGCFWGDDTVVLAGDVANIKLAIDVLAGKKDNLTKGELAAALPKAPAGTALTLAARDLESAPKKENDPGVFIHKFNWLSLVAGESEGNGFLTITGQAKNAEDAQEIRDGLNGLIAFVKMAARHMKAGDPRLADVAELLKGVSIGGEGATVTASGSWPVAKLKEVAEKAIKAKAARIEANKEQQGEGKKN
jgi:hypothetical protein